MKAARRLLALAVLALACVRLAADTDLSQPLPSVTLKDGRVLTNVKIVVFGERDVMARWDGGRGSLHVDQFPDEIAEAIRQKAAPSEAATAPAAPAVEIPSGAEAPANAEPVVAPPWIREGVVTAEDEKAAEELIRSSVEAEGGAALMQVKSMHLIGESSMAGKEGTVPLDMTLAAPHLIRSVNQVQGGVVIAGTGPDGPWEAAKIGDQPFKAVEMTDEQKAQLTRSAESSEFYEPIWHWKELGARIVLVKHSSIKKASDGTSIPTMEVTLLLPGSRVMVYVMAAGGTAMPFLEKAEIIDGQPAYVKDRGDFQRIGPIQYPMRLVTRSTKDSTTFIVQYSQVVLNPDLPPYTFTGPE